MPSYAGASPASIKPQRWTRELHGPARRRHGEASKVDPAKIQQEFARILAPGERVEHAYQLVRDYFVFTDKRFVLADKQGITGSKIEYHSIPYKSITHFSIETAGTFDLPGVSSAQAEVVLRRTVRELEAQADCGPMPIHAPTVRAHVTLGTRSFRRECAITGFRIPVFEGATQQQLWHNRAFERLLNIALERSNAMFAR